MESIISVFHLDVKLLIAQMVNFAIVLAVLYWLAFKPLIKVMSERSAKIEHGLKEAEEITARLEGAKAEQAQILAEAKREAAEIIASARNLGEDKKNQLIAQAKEEIGKVITQEKEQLQAEKAKTLQELKAETADLVVAVCTKLLGQQGSKEIDKNLVNKFLK